VTTAKDQAQNDASGYSSGEIFRLRRLFIDEQTIEHLLLAYPSIHQKNRSDQ
jgi:hypothetical protein